MSKHLTLPNILTLFGIFLAVLAIVLSRNSYIATLLIFIVAIIDCIDGKLARKLNKVSILGAKLDVLNDFLGFILAPILIISFALNTQTTLWFSVLIIYIIAGLYRLIREYFRHSESHFIGLPTTLTALILLSIFHVLTLLNTYLNTMAHTLSLVTFILSVLMISNLSIKRLY